MNRCAELMQRSTSNDAETALEVIAEALTLSSFSEKLLEMKANALFVVCGSFCDTEKFYFKTLESIRILVCFFFELLFHLAAPEV